MEGPLLDRTPMAHVETGIAVIGAGLSGLAIADGLARGGQDVHLFEARDRVGGRILSVPGPQGGRFDLGPAWIWPHNTRMLALAQRFGLRVHGQHATGNLVFEDQTGTIRRDLSFATMGDALRLAGGLAALTDALANGLDDARLHLSHAIDAIDLTGPAVRLTGTSATGPFTLTADRVVLALPPRLAAAIAITPDPGAAVRAALARIPTWMAGHTKLVAVYDRPFWRDSGLSGDAISHTGPLMEIHDASDAASNTPALFGFAMPGIARKDPQVFERNARAQLIRLFGPHAARPAAVLIKDWSTDARTATPQDASPPPNHPAYGLPGVVRERANDRLIFAGTEAAPQDGGFLEGALQSAEAALAALRHPMTRTP